MTAPERSPSDREIARGLTEALMPVLEAQVSALALHAARDVAQLLSLFGLDRLLKALEPHANRPWPREMIPAIDRLRRVTRRCASEADLSVFRRDDAELGALAAEAAAIEWTPSHESGLPATHTVRIADALADLPLASPDAPALADARLSAPAAAALRAAIEWAGGAGGPRRPLEIELDDDVLEVRCTVSDPDGLKAAHAVLGPVGGQISRRAGEARESGRWAVRVPLQSARPRYLMIVQGGANLAMPWSAVLRVLMVPEGEIERTSRAHDAPLLVPVVPLTRAVTERPVVMVASGLLRGMMVADRLVWRLTAEPHDAGSPGPANLEHAVRTEDGGIYWVVDPMRLLAPLPLPPLLDAVPARREEPPPRPEPPPRREPTPARREDPPRRDRPSPRRDSGAAPLRVLESSDVTPITVVADAPAPAAVPEAAPALATEQEPSPALGRPAALVIEDSIAARVFLTRMLESRGFTVTAVGRADKALREMERSRWTLICADVDLPDAAGVDWLRMLMARAHPGIPLVALVRDRQDRDLAGAAGISRSLRKPFDDAEISALMEQLPGRGRSGA